MPSITARYVDIPARKIYPATVTFEQGKITAVLPAGDADATGYILPGFIDAHIHIESSMLLPTEFAAMAVTHGTVATVSDPHEIANVCGIAGVDFMIDNAAQSPLKFYFGAPSCVPATSFETAGASIDAVTTEQLLQRPEIRYLAEMMNFPGVLHQDPEVMAKLAAAKKNNKPVDGHAPAMRGEAVKKYAGAGISTDHECVTAAEAEEKLAAGMHILIREGSAARNFEALIGLLPQYPGRIMFCSDDKHPDELVKGHINQLVIRALEQGCDLFDVLHAASVLPVMHYGLDVGLLRVGDPADFILVGDLEQFGIEATYINGECMAENGRCNFKPPAPSVINNFQAGPKQEKDFALWTTGNEEQVSCRIIEALNGQIITGSSFATLPVDAGKILPDTKQDIIKIGVINRYNDAPVSLGFVRNFGLKTGALASSVAHDSHNIVFAGVEDEAICAAVNAIIQHKGGISYQHKGTTQVMPLPVAGLMTTVSATETAAQYESIDAAVKANGCQLDAPFMTLSFLALPVIPTLKITDKGLFDVDQFDFVAVVDGQ